MGGEGGASESKALLQRCVVLVSDCGEQGSHHRGCTVTPSNPRHHTINPLNRTCVSKKSHSGQVELRQVHEQLRPVGALNLVLLNGGALRRRLLQRLQRRGGGEGSRQRDWWRGLTAPLPKSHSTDSTVQTRQPPQDSRRRSSSRSAGKAAATPAAHVGRQHGGDGGLLGNGRHKAVVDDAGGVKLGLQQLQSTRVEARKSAWR